VIAVPAANETEVAAAAPRTKDVVARLRRIEGQVAGIRRMYEDGRYCIDVLDQLAAARRAIEGAALRILDEHMSGCVLAEVEGGGGAGKVTELLQAVRRYVRSL
jgi:CsoR family transcriptional regulator, copper-sensing transcriptional repressor